MAYLAPPASAPVAVVGAGTMGIGIAYVAATAGHPVLLYDQVEGRARDAIVRIKNKAKGKADGPHNTAHSADRITPAQTLEELSSCSLVIEAVVEDISVKQHLFEQLEKRCSPDTILATNTSFLSITAMASVLSRPERLAGMHFFNPAPLMSLVEIIPGLATDSAVISSLSETARLWGKIPVTARPTPGFIVNRIARPFYAESLRLLEEGVSDPSTLDAILREGGAFRMGPFELMDMIGHDINFAVTSGLHRALFGDRRYLPSLVQKELVDAGRLGRKSGIGFYSYAATDTPRPSASTEIRQNPPRNIVLYGTLPFSRRLETPWPQAETHPGTGYLMADGITIAPSDGRTATEMSKEYGQNNLIVFDTVHNWDTASRIALAASDNAEPSALAKAAGFFQSAGFSVSVIDDTPGLVVTRTVAMLANEAAEAVLTKVANPADIDLAMKAGVNWPSGPLEWAERIGLEKIYQILDNLFRTTRDSRYRPSALLRRKVMGGTSFHA